MTESTQAQPALKFLPPSYKGWVLTAVHRLLPLYLRSQCGVVEVEGENTEVLVDYYRQFQEGKIRFLMAYRHPTTSDPPSLIQYLHTQVPKVAADIGVKLKPPIFAYFLYERGIPMWAGPAAGKLLPAIGGIPIIRGRPDRDHRRRLQRAGGQVARRELVRTWFSPAPRVPGTQAHRPGTPSRPGAGFATRPGHPSKPCTT